jgi:hypothetical protein
MSRTSAFDLDSMMFQDSSGDYPPGGYAASLSTVISGYYNGTLVKTFTNESGFCACGFPISVNMDGVNDIKFTTSYTLSLYGVGGYTVTYPDATLVSQMTVDNFSSAVKAPELDPTATASAVMLLLGSLLVMNGRRARRSYIE